MLCLALCLAPAALAPLAAAQHPGGGGPGGGAAPGMQQGGQMGGEHGGSPAMSGVGGGPGFRGNGGVGQMPSIRSGSQAAIPGRFWNDSSMARALHLRPEQQHRMDAVFEANRSTLQTLFTNLQREEATLSAISPKGADQTKVFAAIDRVAQARADLEKEKSQLAQALRKEMDPDQVQQLQLLSTAH